MFQEDSDSSQILIGLSHLWARINKINIIMWQTATLFFLI